MTLSYWSETSVEPLRAPDGSWVRPLAGTERGSMATFRLPAGRVAAAVVHRSVEEVWFVGSGAGQIWRRHDGIEQIDPLEPGSSLALPVGCEFQFRATEDAELFIVGVTMPPWPGEGEARIVNGPWTPTPTPTP